MPEVDRSDRGHDTTRLLHHSRAGMGAETGGGAGWRWQRRPQSPLGRWVLGADDTVVGLAAGGCVVLRIACASCVDLCVSAGGSDVSRVTCVAPFGAQILFLLRHG